MNIPSMLQLFVSIGLILMLNSPDVPAASVEPEENRVLSLSLEQCLEIAFENNRKRRVSRYAVEIADAQHQQALAAWWPQLKMTVSADRMGKNPNFVFPEETSTYTIQGIAPVPVETVVTVPEKDVRLMDRDNLLSALDLLWPIYTGGKRRAIAEQARIGLKIAKNAARRTDTEIVRDVKQMYYGCILAKHLRQLGQDTHEQLRATLDLTEYLYKNGAGRVKKTDYLRTKMMVAAVAATSEELKSNEALAGSALVNTLGLDWHTRLEPSEARIPFVPFESDLTESVAHAYAFNPDWSQISLALSAAEAKIREARSGHLPVIALTGTLAHLENAYDKGVVSSNNRDQWRIGMALELPLFSGFRTRHEIREARARLDKMKQEKILLREGIALQVKDAFLQIRRARAQVNTLKESLDVAVENRELNIRAYQNELVETKEVIEAQITEALIKGQYLKALYDHVVSRAGLEFIIGSDMKKMLRPEGTE